VYLSTASGSSRDSRDKSSCRDSPVCSDNVAQTSGLIAPSSSCGEIDLFGPVLTQESAISLLPLDLKLSTKSLKPPLKSPPTLVPLRMPPKLPIVPANRKKAQEGGHGWESAIHVHHLRSDPSNDGPRNWFRLLAVPEMGDVLWGVASASIPDRIGLRLSYALCRHPAEGESQDFGITFPHRMRITWTPSLT
jgi:hypothetical protein